MLQYNTKNAENQNNFLKGFWYTRITYGDLFGGNFHQFAIFHPIAQEILVNILLVKLLPKYIHAKDIGSDSVYFFTNLWTGLVNKRLKVKNMIPHRGLSSPWES